MADQSLLADRVDKEFGTETQFELLSGFTTPTRSMAASLAMQTHIGVGIETNINVEKLLNPVWTLTYSARIGISRSQSLNISGDNTETRFSPSLTQQNSGKSCFRGKETWHRWWPRTLTRINNLVAWRWSPKLKAEELQRTEGLGWAGG